MNTNDEVGTKRRVPSKKHAEEETDLWDPIDSWWINRRNREEYERYIKSAPWRTKRQKRLEYDNYRCVVCGSKGTEEEPLEVHHLTYERLGKERLSDLRCLCPRCHEFASEIASSKDVPGVPWVWADSTFSFSKAAELDAENLAPKVFKYLMETVKLRGVNALDEFVFSTLYSPKRYWIGLKEVVWALVANRYFTAFQFSGERSLIVFRRVYHRVENLCQRWMHERVLQLKGDGLSVAAIEEHLNIGKGVYYRIHNGKYSVSQGPHIRASFLYEYGLDACAGVKPDEWAKGVLSDVEYKALETMAEWFDSKWSEYEPYQIPMGSEGGAES